MPRIPCGHATTSCLTFSTVVQRIHLRPEQAITGLNQLQPNASTVLSFCLHFRFDLDEAANSLPNRCRNVTPAFGFIMEIVDRHKFTVGTLHGPWVPNIAATTFAPHNDLGLPGLALIST